MSAANAVVVAGAALLGMATFIGFLLSDNDPENGCSHSERHLDAPTERLHAGVDRPAGPDAEQMNPELLGGDVNTPRRQHATSSHGAPLGPD